MVTVGGDIDTLEVVFIELDECPTTVGLELVGTGNPVCLHHRLLGIRVQVAVTLHLDKEMQRIVSPMPIIDERDDRRKV